MIERHVAEESGPVAVEGTCSEDSEPSARRSGICDE
jgi:hypothetical protein